MTIASAFNEITVAQGGTASKSGSIAGAIDKLNDVLAGSDQEAASTIEQAVRLLGQHIGGGGGGGDFTTATVTLQNAEGSVNALQLNCACIASEEGLPEASFTSQYSESTSHEFTAILYKGKCLASLARDDATVTTAGDVTYDSDLEIYIITGDCTFTFSDE